MFVLWQQSYFIRLNESEEVKTRLTQAQGTLSTSAGPNPNLQCGQTHQLALGIFHANLLTYTFFAPRYVNSDIGAIGITLWVTETIGNHYLEIYLRPHVLVQDQPNLPAYNFLLTPPPPTTNYPTKQSTHGHHFTTNLNHQRTTSYQSPTYPT